MDQLLQLYYQQSSDIPVIVLKYVPKKQDVKFVRLYFLFAVFTPACGSIHFPDAVSFWIPIYHLNALVRFIPAVLSWIAIFYLVKFLHAAFFLKSQTELTHEDDIPSSIK